MVVMDLNLFSRVFKYTPLSKESIFLPKQGQARGGILEVWSWTGFFIFGHIILNTSSVMAELSLVGAGQ